MDWSSVYDDEGNGTPNYAIPPDIVLDSIETNSVSRTLRSLFYSSEEDINGNAYTPLVCYAFTVNYILGVGCLGMPYAFLQGGIFLGIALIILLSFTSYITVMWVATAVEQEKQLRLYLDSNNPFFICPMTLPPKSKLSTNSSSKLISLDKVADQPPRLSISASFDEMSRLISGRISSAKTYGSSSFSSALASFQQPIASSTYTAQATMDRNGKKLAKKKQTSAEANKEVEVIDLVVGRCNKVLYQTSLIILAYVGLLAYTQV